MAFDGAFHEFDSINHVGTGDQKTVMISPGRIYPED
jgi:hypothetical protein